MRLGRSIAAVFVLAIVATLPVHSARADERADARRHFHTGMGLITQHHYADGIVELQAAYAILPHPNVLYNIARAYNDLGDTEHAIEYLRRYLQSDVPDRADVEGVVARLEARLRERDGPTVATPEAATPPVVASSAPPASSNEPVVVASASPVPLETPSSAPPSSAAPQLAPRETIGAASADAQAYEEQIVTASRQAQSPLDAPNATGIITAQDIRLSGITNVALLLRRLVGMDVMQLDYSDVQVSARGFNQRLSNKMLVLVDGRSVYLDFMGVTLWAAVPVSVEDIDRIEVIRGPGSALYGADAFTGVVNIITRTPGERRTQASFGGGNGAWLRGAFTTSGREGAVAYRASASYEQAATYGRPVSDTNTTYRLTAPDHDIGFRAPRITLDLLSRLSRDTTLRGGIGISAPTDWFSAIGPLRQYWSQLVFVQPYVQLDAGGLTARLFYNRFQAQAEPLVLQIGTNPQVANVQQDVIDADAQYAYHTVLGPFRATLQGGASYRGKNISWNYLDGDHFIHHAAVYLQGTLRNRWIEFVASGRGDVDTALAAPIFSPRGSVIIRPDEFRAIRLSGGTAFRTPTMLELYLDLTNNTPVPGASAQATGGDIVPNMGATIQPEQGLSFDLGYQDQHFLGTDRITFEANLFWTRAWNLIQLSPVALYGLPGGCPTPGANDPRCNDTRVSVGTGGFYNDPAATYIYGGEVSARVAPIDGLDVYANYTLSLTQHDQDALLNGGNGLPPDQRTPVHKFNIGVQLRTHFGLDLELFAHYVSSQLWLEQVFDATQGVRYQAFQISDYVVVTGRVGYRLLNDRLDLGLVGSNLTDQTILVNGHVEHPFGNQLSARVMATASYRF